MSTQAARSIPFTHTTPQEGFKLLELPPELVELICSNEAPTLELKSHSPSQSLSQSEPDEARDYVNLCTPDKTYQVRQVQSSNSLHILRPGTNATIVGNKNEVYDSGDDDMGMELAMNTEAVTSIAQCSSTLELHMPNEGFSAVPFLVKMLGVYSGSEDREDVDLDMVDDEEGENASNTMNTLFADIPVAKAQCEQGWVELCAFVLRSNANTNNAPGANCWRPSAKVKVDVWKRVVEGAVLQGINLEQQFLVNDLWKSVLDDNGEEPFPRGLFEAVIRRVCEADSTTPGETMQWTKIEKLRCVQWIGETYLEAKAPTATSALGRSEFLNAWKDHLPESWRSEVAFSKLPEGSYKLPDPTSICYVKEGDRLKVKKNLSTDASAATTAKKSRNWHELFKNQRRR